MNISEREQLTLFLQQLTQAQAGPKDAEAQSLIARATAQQPDAAYLLVQRALLQDGALKVAQQKMTELQAELDGLKPQARPAGGFLDANAWGRAPASPVAASAFASNATAQPPAGYYPPAPAAPAVPAAAPSAGFQAPSFLTSMATTAAGVAAGAFLFQGIGHLMGNHQGAGASAFGLSDPQAANGFNVPSSQPTEIINNYYDSTPTGTDNADRFLDASSGNDGFDSAGLDLDPSDDWT